MNGFVLLHTTPVRVQVLGPLLEILDAQPNPPRPTRSEDRVRGICRVQDPARRGARSDRGGFLVLDGVHRSAYRRRSGAADRAEPPQLLTQPRGPRPRKPTVRRPG